MSTVRFGQACDTCPKAYPDYNSGSDIGTCEDCQADLCPRCARETSHTSRECDGRIYLSCTGRA
jgi:hypothetical protein